jgi:carboxyl-terminal processing protease
LIIGDSQTFGKATVQAVQDLPGSQGRQSDGAIKVTQNKFYRPSGNSNQEVGVKSDVQLPSVLDVYDIGEKEEDYVLKTDTIKPSADFRPEDRFKKLLPSLAERSQNRIKASKEFKELLEVVEKAKNDKNKTTVSLADSEAQKSGDTSKSATNPNKNAKNKEKPKKKQNGADPEIRAVVKEDDIILTEAGHILVDAMELAK